MAKFCPSCGKELDDNQRFCTHCGFKIDNPEQPDVQITPPDNAFTPEEESTKTILVQPEFFGGPVIKPEVSAEPVIQPADVDEPAIPPVTVGEPVPAAQPAVTADPIAPAQPSFGNNTPSVTYHPGNPDAPVDAVPLQNKPSTEKKNKYLGLGITICVLAVLLVAAIVTIVILLIPKGGDEDNEDNEATSTATAEADDAEEAVENYLNAWLDKKYEEYFGMDYNTIFLNDNLEEAVKNAEEYSSSDPGVKFKVIGTTAVKDDAFDDEVKYLEKNGCKDTDKIEEIKLVTIQLSYEDQNLTGFTIVTVIKVDGKYYASTNPGSQY